MYEILAVRILIAPDKFKGALNAREIAENIATGLLDVLPDAQIELVPMADGGEGTAEAICDARGCSWLECKAHDPLGREIEARYGWIDRERLAVMEMSEAAGMRRLSEIERDPIRATTFGVGEMILDATKRGARKIIIGLGGSATNDGAFGMARALGFRFFAGAKELTGAVTGLATHEDRFAGKRCRGARRGERTTKRQVADTAASTTIENHSGGGREECVAGREWCDKSLRSTERSKQSRPR